MPLCSFDVRQIANTYLAFRLLFMIWGNSVVVIFVRPEVPGSHAPFPSCLIGRAIEVIPSIQVRIFVSPRIDPFRSPQEFQPIILQKQVVKDATSPHDVVNFFSILVPACLSDAPMKEMKAVRPALHSMEEMKASWPAQPKAHPVL